ncbi:serine hydrolase [Colwellia psychrerythraea]|uniref:Beta-lactamase n=1 Tax=Colwellia psychrerythraea TaxID=28229 RepID=A0A099KJC9_COLPS|nr:serine hydrolase [Colwellia psychrerythraea]KGJ90939.1 beta-lactamase [Colwellia psychrerythraea]
MKFHIFFIAYLLVISSSSKADEQISDLISTQLDQQLKLNSERYGIAGQSVRILKNNKLIYQGKHGFANVELAVPIADKHIYPGYSVTKLFTSVLVMYFVENGILDVKKSIRYYLPYLPKHWQKITLEHTLNHTSGIPRYFDIAMKKGRFLPTKKAVFLSLAEEPEHFVMGSENRYNNTNFLILSEILETKTAKSYQTLVQEFIIKRLGLTNTGHASAKAIITNMVSSYQGKDGILLKNNDIDWPEYTYAHSGLYSTAEDLTTFMSALVTGKLVNRDTLTKVQQPMALLNGQQGDYAFGFEYEKRDGYQQIGHDGGNRVKIRHYFKDDANEDSYTIAYLTNGNANSVWTDILADSLMAIVDAEQFNMAHLSQQFISAVLAQDSKNLQLVYAGLSKAFDSEQSAIEYFIWYNAYGIRYSAGLNASLSAFVWLTSKFPNSEKAWSSLAGIWQEIGNKEKAIKSYQIALKLNPNANNVIEQLKLLKK